MGLTPAEYWNLTPKQYISFMKGYAMKQRRQAKEDDANSWALARYIGTAINAPKSYPRKPHLADLPDDPSAQKPMTDEEMEANMRRNTILLGGTVIKNDHRRTKGTD